MVGRLIKRGEVKSEVISGTEAREKVSDSDFTLDQMLGNSKVGKPQKSRRDKCLHLMNVLNPTAHTGAQGMVAEGCW